VRRGLERARRTDNAGAGIKIGLLDTGIDQNHPAFQDPSLTPPAGFPKYDAGNLAYTNNKVIVARSYVSVLAAGSPGDPAADSRPDDLSPRDRMGHGTALAMIAAGAPTPRRGASRSPASRPKPFWATIRSSARPASLITLTAV